MNTLCGQIQLVKISSFLRLDVLRKFIDVGYGSGAGRVGA